MYKLYLINAKDWQSNWNLILDNLNLKLKKESDKQYDILHNKLNGLQRKANAYYV
jgi:hypothetical protein